MTRFGERGNKECEVLQSQYDMATMTVVTLLT